MRRRTLAGIAPLLLVTCELEPTPICGDGIVDAPEQCDDTNGHDGDGCSSICTTEPADPTCFDVTQSEDATPTALLATADGHILIGGTLTTAGTNPHGWLGAFDAEGTQLWSLDLDDHTALISIISRDEGFSALALSPTGHVLLDMDSAGAVVETFTFPELDEGNPGPMDMIETESGLLFAGGISQSAPDSLDVNLWLGRLGADGNLETVLTEDHAGLEDRFGALARSGGGSGGEIGALASVGVAQNTSDDLAIPDTRDTHLIIFDEQAQELERVVLSSDDPRVSLIGNDLAASADGAWIISGVRENTVDQDGVVGWVAAVAEGEVQWSFESPGSAEPKFTYPSASFVAAVAATQVLVAGQLNTSEGVRRWAVSLDASSGELLSEQIGAPLTDGYDRYAAASEAIEGSIWLSGVSGHAGGVTQWLCSAAL